MKKKKIEIGIIGFGRFGILAATVLSEFFKVRVHHYRRQKANESVAKKIGVELTDLKTTLGCDYLILAVPISQTKKLIQKIAPLLTPRTTVLDICSVKTLPCKWLRQYLPKENEILGTHPMFGPVTTKFDLEKKYFELKDKQLILCPVRISSEKLAAIKDFLQELELKVMTVSPEEHDRQNAKTLSLVHFLGRSLTVAGIGEQEIFTPGYTDLLRILPHTNNDDWQLFYDMNNYNPYSEQVRAEFLGACQKVEKKIIKADSPDEFEFNRKLIGKIDAQLFALLEERMRCAKEIGKYKKKKGLVVVDPKREKELVKNIDLNTDLNIDFIKKVYRVIFEESYKQQK